MRYLFEAVMTTALVFALTGLTWWMAHLMVAHECETLGAFYIGHKVYECKLKQGGKP